MLWHGPHCIITNSCRHSTAYPRWVGEERVETAVAAIVEIDVYSTVIGEHEIADGVCALDWKGVAVEGGEEPGVFCADEVARFFVCP